MPDMLEDKDKAATPETLKASEWLIGANTYRSALSKYLQALRAAKNANP